MILESEKVEFEAFCKKFPGEPSKRTYSIPGPPSDESFERLSSEDKLQIIKNFKNINLK